MTIIKASKARRCADQVNERAVDGDVLPMVYGVIRDAAESGEYSVCKVLPDMAHHEWSALERALVEGGYVVRREYYYDDSRWHTYTHLSWGHDHAKK